MFKGLKKFVDDVDAIPVTFEAVVIVLLLLILWRVW